MVDNGPLARGIGARILAARREAGLTQRELAGERYTGAYISALEKGIAKPSMAALAYIAETLGVSTVSLVGAGDERWAVVQADLFATAKDHARAIELYQRLLETSVGPARTDLLLALARALWASGMRREALSTVTEARDLIRANSDDRIDAPRRSLSNKH